jgi:hypothetical protein
MRKILLSLTAALCLAASAAHPFDPKSDEAFVFFDTSCGQWLSDRTKSAQSAADRLYVAGWLSAWNFYVPGANLRGEHWVDDAIAWIDRYCRDNPFQTMQQALFAMLPRSPRK